MIIELSQEPVTEIAAYATVPIAFAIHRVLDVEVRPDCAEGFLLSERELAVPYLKDYDAIEGAIEGEGPLRWSSRFDVSNWVLFVARVEGRRVGGAAIAVNTPGLEMLEGRPDLAVLWDIRISPGARGSGVGSALFGAVEKWAASHDYRQLKIETQNVNVPACRFYERQGCMLRSIRHFAYPNLPDEVQRLWYKDLS
jgi:GNAT superfamily N-acetyltransferase